MLLDATGMDSFLSFSQKVIEPWALHLAGSDSKVQGEKGLTFALHRASHINHW